MKTEKLSINKSWKQHWVAMTCITDDDILISNPTSSTATSCGRYKVNGNFQFGFCKKRLEWEK